MHFKPGHTYYLRSSTFSNTVAFPTRANYRFFIAKLRTIGAFADLLCYCLAPDHFQLLIHVSEHSFGLRRTSNDQMQVLSRAIGTLLSSYARAYNKQMGRRGSLFQPKTKSSLLNESAAEFFHHIHQSPVRLGLAFESAEWEFSSFNEYQNQTRGVCNTVLGRRLLGL